MTHSLHRRGDPEDLKNDFVVLITPAVGINHRESREKLSLVLDKIASLGPDNIGSYETGSIFSGADITAIKREMKDTPRVRCCFTEKEKVLQLVRYIMENEFGLSVTISGLITEIKDVSKELNIQPHSINLSLGVFGNTSSLPEEEVLKLTTMCGHGMISPALVKHLKSQIDKGEVTPREAAKTMAAPCVCGIFNTLRAEKLLKGSLENE